MHKRLGFTMVELIIVIVVIGILSTIVVVSYNGIANRSKTVGLQSDLITAANKLDKIKSDRGAYPADLTAAQSAGLSFASDITPQYSFFGKIANVSGHYCLTLTRDNISSHIASGGVPTRGPCVGHTGDAPTDPDDGGECPAGFIVVPGSSYFNTKSFCVMKYEAKDGGSNTPVSTASGDPWVSINYNNAKAYSKNTCDGCHLITEAEWMTIAANLISVGSNWSGGSVGSGVMFVGHTDGTPAAGLVADSNDANGFSGTGQSSGSQRRTLTLTNGNVIWDFSGNVHEKTDAGLSAGEAPGLSGETATAWKDWDNPNLILNKLPSYSHPGSISPTVVSYTSSQQVGKLNSNYGQSDNRYFYRGGSYNTGETYAGVVSLLTSSATATSTSTAIGFRVAR